VVKLDGHTDVKGTSGARPAFREQIACLIRDRDGLDLDDKVLDAILHFELLCFPELLEKLTKDVVLFGEYYFFQGINSIHADLSP
jgi:hypothetical protein